MNEDIIPYTAQVVTLKDVLISGRKIINEGKLQAQQKPVSLSPTCANFQEGDESIRCIIGSVLNDETVAEVKRRFRQYSPLRSLEEAKLVWVDRQDRGSLNELQHLHDSAVQDPAEYPTFITLFERLEKEHGLHTAGCNS